jgi:hypothetical protein
MNCFFEEPTRKLELADHQGRVTEEVVEAEQLR